MPPRDRKGELIRACHEDPWWAHRMFFPHRHQVPAAEFHQELVEDFWSDERESIRMAYRGSGKSTLGEEDIALAAALRAWNNIVIIGSSEARAAERLQVVKYELETNEQLIEVFGEQVGNVWTQTKIVTQRNVCVQAMGRDQDIRGLKFLEWRPQFVFVDDFEDKDTVQTPEGRIKTMRWFVAELMPACAAQRKVRIRATPMDAESVPMRLMNEAKWPCKIYPIEHVDAAGKRRASWPEGHSLAWIDNERKTYERVGELAVWEREFMCRAIAETDVLFKKEMIRVDPREKTWEPCFAFIDPARTVGQSSATTGWAVWSWIRNRLVVWAADGQLLLPDEVVALGFDICERFDPVWLGYEEDSLNEWLLQPIRQEMARRGQVIPYKAVAATSGTKGLGKTRFIRGLQPFFKAGEVVFSQPLPTLLEQLLNFPRGRIDVPNALAYALTMRPGLPIYEHFADHHIVESPDYDRSRPLFLAANATPAATAAALCQLVDGRLTVLSDWLVEGLPGEAVAKIWQMAVTATESTRIARVRQTPRAWDEMLKAPMPDRLVMRRQLPVWCIGQRHADKYTNVGLMQAIKQIPAEVRLGGIETQGQAYLSDLLSKNIRGNPAVEIGSAARWTLRALAGGYTRALKNGRVQDFAEDGPYRLLMEGLEAFCGLMRTQPARDDEEEEGDPSQNWSRDRRGNLYKSALPMR